VDGGGTLAVEFRGKGSGIDNTHFGALKANDAIVHNLRERAGRRPSVGQVNPDVRPRVRRDRPHPPLNLGRTRDSLHQRGALLQ
ncbi:THUMP domain-containing protein, partial [Pseudomonas aeruginosa]